MPWVSYHSGLVPLCCTIPFLAIPLGLKSQNLIGFYTFTAILIFVDKPYLRIIQALITKEKINWILGLSFSPQS